MPVLFVSPVLAALLSSSALAADATNFPPNLRGDVHLGYLGDLEQVGIEERGETYAIRNTVRHDLGIQAEVGVYHGVAVTLGFPVNIQQRISYPSAREMLFEPVEGRGSYVNGEEITAPSFTSGGSSGVWIGAAVQPLSTKYKRSLPIETRFDLAVRTPGRKATMYGANRGGHPGGAALRIAGAFSLQNKRVDPYVTFDYTQEFAATVDTVVDNDGNILAQELPIRGASRLDALLGAEFILRDETEKKSRVAIDLHLGVGYRSWADRASGFHLPDVLDTSRSVPVTRSEFVLIRGGGGVRYDVNKWVGIRLGAEGRYFTPRTIENVYDMRTDGQSYAVSWNVGLVGRIRLKED